MRRVINLVMPAVILPACLFLILAVPAIEEAADARQPLVPIHDISKQMAWEIGHAEAANDGLPTRYASIVTEYGAVPDSRAFRSISGVSEPIRSDSYSVLALAEFILWNRNLPGDLLIGDPAREIVSNVETVRRKEKQMDARRERLLAKHRLECLKDEVPNPDRRSTVRIGLPPNILTKGLVFCGERIPLGRADVRRRIGNQVEYLLTDLHDSTGIWLTRKDRYGSLVGGILKQEGVPKEFTLLPALESGYRGRVYSPTRARGWWQFGKPTAIKSLAKDPNLDWTLQVNDRRDERCDLVLSTISAAKYLKWIRRKLKEAAGKGSWLTTSAAYNAGLSKIRHRTAVYNTPSYWDMKLPLETETYVPRWIALHIIDTHREHYGLEISPIAPIKLETLNGIRLEKDLPLRLLAAITASPESFIREINGGVRKGDPSVEASGNSGSYVPGIHVPEGSGKRVLKELEARAFLKE